MCWLDIAWTETQPSLWAPLKTTLAGAACFCPELNCSLLLARLIEVWHVVILYYCSLTALDLLEYKVDIQIHTNRDNKTNWLKTIITQYQCNLFLEETNYILGFTTELIVCARQCLKAQGCCISAWSIRRKRKHTSLCKMHEALHLCEGVCY